ncbi:SUN domain-containing protein 3-like [Frankliniella occidentalis]|uniref:SUN domain-containing protein 3-like n=1 Tax=Frankliniella occidentalis TaxID=133901 RepID=A0A9C6X3Q3_FRAOC|nr:SUN domain-containing protein 3-like [Frankliniella occidentalis]
MVTAAAAARFCLQALPGPVLDEHAVEVGRFVYEVGSAPLQTFNLPVKLNRSFRYVALAITSNHGHPDFTCVYRFRVHGSLDAQGHVHKRLEHETVGRN